MDMRTDKLKELGEQEALPEEGLSKSTYQCRLSSAVLCAKGHNSAQPILWYVSHCIYKPVTTSDAVKVILLQIYLQDPKCVSSGVSH